MTDATHTTAAAAAHASGGLPQFDPSWWPGQIVWVIAIFTVFYLMLNKVLLPQAQRAIVARRNQIAADSDAAQRMQAEIEAAKAAADQAIAEARARGSKLAAEAREAVSAEISKAQAVAEADLTAKLDKAEASIREARAKAMDHVHNIAAEAAADIVRKLAGIDMAKSDPTLFSDVKA